MRSSTSTASRRARSGSTAARTTPAALALDDLEVATRHGRLRLSEPKVEMAPGERVLILGRQEGGKSTLFQAIAGLWACGTGRIGLPPPDETMFLAAGPFLPMGTLREALAYAAPGAQPGDAELAAALRRVGLDRLAGSLDTPGRWDRELTLDEQERLGYARLLIGRPKWLVCRPGLRPDRRGQPRDHPVDSSRRAGRHRGPQHRQHAPARGLLRPHRPPRRRAGGEALTTAGRRKPPAAGGPPRRSGRAAWRG